MAKPQHVCLRAVAAVAVVLGFACLLAPADASASRASNGAVGDPTYRVTAVAGSSRFLVYTRYRLKGGKPSRRGSVLVVNRFGRVRRLGAITDLDQSFSLSGTNVFTDTDTGTGATVTLWNAATGAEHHLKQLYGKTPEAAAPTGYLAQQTLGSDPTRLFVVSVAGNSRSLGSPFPDGQTFFTQTGSTWLVAYEGDAEQKGGIRAERFSKPSRVHILLPSTGDPGQATCGVPTAKYLACWVDVGANNLELFRLDGGAVAGTSVPCDPSGDVLTPTAKGPNAVWLPCTAPRHLFELSLKGTVTSSRAVFANVPPVHALHEIVVSNPSRTALIGLPTATSKLRAIVSER
jgi:hypothetical protein